MSISNLSEEKNIAHEIKLSGRNTMSISGVEEVVGFDEENVHLRTGAGELFVEGKDIKIGTLDTQQGVVALTGRINALYYSSDEGREKKGFFSRLAR